MSRHRKIAGIKKKRKVIDKMNRFRQNEQMLNLLNRLQQNEQMLNLLNKINKCQQIQRLFIFPIRGIFLPIFPAFRAMQAAFLASKLLPGPGSKPHFSPNFFLKILSTLQTRRATLPLSRGRTEPMPGGWSVAFRDTGKRRFAYLRIPISFASWTGEACE
jgi:hypothetical protein